MRRLMIALALTGAGVMAQEASAKVKWSGALASWYQLSGNGLACGGTMYDGQLGVAHKTLRCGSKVRLRHNGRYITVRVIDRGPFVAGREFDLTQETKNRLRCSDLCSVQWRIPRR